MNFHALWMSMVGSLLCQSFDLRFDFGDILGGISSGSLLDNNTYRNTMEYILLSALSCSWTFCLPTFPTPLYLLDITVLETCLRLASYAFPRRNSLSGCLLFLQRQVFYETWVFFQTQMFSPIHCHSRCLILVRLLSLTAGSQTCPNPIACAKSGVWTHCWRSSFVLSTYKTLHRIILFSCWPKRKLLLHTM